MKNSSTTPATPSTPAEYKVIELRKEGIILAKIMDETGVSERRVRALTKGIQKGKKPSAKTSKIPTALTKATDRAFELAVTGHGIRDYELRNILHEEYGCSWDTSTGRYKSNYTDDTLYRVKQKVRQQANNENRTAIFSMDWIDETAPRSSSEFLISAAADIQSRTNEWVNEYMALHGTRQADKDGSTELARKKQLYAVEQHLVKLAINGYGNEPVEKLLERTANLVGRLERNPDLEYAESTETKADRPSYYPEPSGLDHFLDYAESQGWLI